MKEDKRVAFQTIDCPIHGPHMPFVRAPQQEQGAVKDVPGRAKVMKKKDAKAVRAMQEEMRGCTTERLEERLRNVVTVASSRCGVPFTGAWILGAVKELSDRRKAGAW